MVDIFTTNQLRQTNEQVYVPEDDKRQPFSYSDGAEVEQYLHQVFSQTEDLSSFSPALQQQIIDWPSEYHLSSDRANLLRPFNLESVGNALEMGSGCGAISRYLGEQGIQVDAIEGSPIRAALGKLRCKEQDNVRVINANYNDLEIPKAHYDMVLFVGVIEYAHKFHPEAATDQEAAFAILHEAKSYLKPGGVVLVAIENRLGLKYMLGAHEDHYAKRYVGINDYREPAGIATYSRKQWDSLISEVGFDHAAFSYPFPDYKIPKVLLSESYVQNNVHASNHLEGMISRDYYAPIKRSITEAICWQGAAHGSFLGDISNSFCIVMGDDEKTITKIQNFDFCHGPSNSRKPHYAVTTTKRHGDDRVIKTPITTRVDASDATTTQVLTQQLAEQPFIRGDLLSAQWLRTILIYTRRDEFEASMREYYAFLSQAEKNGTLKIDLLPINILIDQNNQWQVFDQEWEVKEDLSKEFLLFRALLTFIVTNWVHLKDYLGWLELQTVQDFIEYGFHTNMIHLSEHLPSFIAEENKFQKAIARDEDGQDVNALLATVFDFSEGTHKIYSSIYWQEQNQEFSEENKSTIAVIPDPASQQLCFPLPVDRTTTINTIRFDPFDLRKPEDVGFYQVSNIALMDNANGSEKLLWQIQEADAIATACEASSATFEANSDSNSWIATTAFPKMTFALDQGIAVTAESSLVVKIDICLSQSKEYALAYQRYIVNSEQLYKVQNRVQQNLDATKVILQHKEVLIEHQQAMLENMANLENDLKNARAEIDLIKASKPFRYGTKFVQLASPLNRLRGKG